MTIPTADIKAAIKSYEQADRKSKKAMERRLSLGPGASHSRKGAWTTANANWQAAAEARDKAKGRLFGLMRAALEKGVE